jgi:hypothetical protein
MIWPTPEPVTLTVHTGSSCIDIPVRLPRRGERAPVFAPAEAAAPVKLIERDKPFNKREVTIDQRTGVQKAVGRQQVRYHRQVHAHLSGRHRLHDDAQVPRQPALAAAVEVGGAEVGAVERAGGVG